jgi:hypothetical protein
MARNLPQPAATTLYVNRDFSDNIIDHHSF